LVGRLVYQGVFKRQAEKRPPNVDIFTVGRALQTRGKIFTSSASARVAVESRIMRWAGESDSRGMQVSDVMKFITEKDIFARYLGIELAEVSPGRAVARMEVQDHHLNGVGIVHGGALFALADLAFAAASNSHGTIAVGINATISYIKAAQDGILYAEAVEASRNHKLAVYQVTVKDEQDQVLSVFQGMVYRKKDKLP